MKCWLVFYSSFLGESGEGGNKLLSTMQLTTFLKSGADLLQEPNKSSCFRTSFIWPRIKNSRGAGIDIKSFGRSSNTILISFKGDYIQVNQVPREPGFKRNHVNMSE